MFRERKSIRNRPVLSNAVAALASEDDAALARRIVGRDERAFEVLMRAHNRLLYRLARSILRDDADAEDAAFLAELQQLHEINPNYRLIATMTESQESSRAWSGETGFLRREMLQRHLPDFTSRIYYFAGPPAMATGMQQMLERIGIDEQAMRYEELYGY
jgi:Na+-transporting NADH:ubiquinone oxidoreductase subunit NqrF